MRESTGKTALHVLRYGLLCGLLTGASSIFLLILQSIFLITQYDPMDQEFYTSYCFYVPLLAALLGTLVGAILAIFIDSRNKLLVYISVTALVIGTIASLIGLDSLLSWKGI